MVRRRSKYFMDVGASPVADERSHDMCKLFFYNNKQYVNGMRFKSEHFTNEKIARKTGLRLIEVENVRTRHDQLMRMKDSFVKQVIINEKLPPHVEETCFSMLTYSKIAAVNYYLFSTLDKWITPRYERKK